MEELECCTNYIKEVIDKIDKMQKRVIVDENNTCIFCETSLFSSVNNTIPITLQTRCATPITGNTNLELTTTPFFRIEAIRCGRYVTLRMLSATTAAGTTTITATDRTMIVDLDTVGAIQCYEPINVTLCNQTTNT